jgi:hypothetical protein
MWTLIFYVYARVFIERANEYNLIVFNHSSGEGLNEEVSNDIRFD